MDIVALLDIGKALVTVQISSVEHVKKMDSHQTFMTFERFQKLYLNSNIYHQSFCHTPMM